MISAVGISLMLVAGHTQAETAAPSVLDSILATATCLKKDDMNISASTQVFTSEEIKETGAKKSLEVIITIPDFVLSWPQSGNGLPGIQGHYRQVI